MVQYTKTSTGKRAVVGSKHVIDGRTFEVQADGKMKNLGKVSAATVAKPAVKVAPAAKKAAPKVAMKSPARRPGTGNEMLKGGGSGVMGKQGGAMPSAPNKVTVAKSGVGSNKDFAVHGGKTKMAGPGGANPARPL